MNRKVGERSIEIIEAGMVYYRFQCKILEVVCLSHFLSVALLSLPVLESLYVLQEKLLHA